ncbi:MAG: hypothetical protein AB7V04_01090, partial [Desulfomonilaceae bacterium]
MRLKFWTIVKGVFLVCLLVMLALGGHLLYTKIPYLIKEINSETKNPQSQARQDVIVTIPKGASLSEVGEILQNNGIISSKLIFKLVAFIRGEQRNVKAGD